MYVQWMIVPTFTLVIPSPIARPVELDLGLALVEPVRRPHPYGEGIDSGLGHEPGDVIHAREEILPA